VGLEATSLLLLGVEQVEQVDPAQQRVVVTDPPTLLSE
jgi:hypothetical protein